MPESIKIKADKKKINQVIYNLIIVLTILLGEELIKVLITSYLASNSQITIRLTISSICTRCTSILVIFFFLINLLCSSLYMEINILPYLIIILFKFFFISITNRSTLILHFNIINTLNPCWSIR